ncbi:MAG TPA: hypothetical protein VEL74_24305 [Thermoanaerobaculia bacterium]|nr:hypothetical protein [Thermoanaerobaculia bacterium]
METEYDDAEVRHRITEFLGGPSLEEAKCVFLVGYGPAGEAHGPAPPSVLPDWLEQGLDVRRSLWDRGSLLAVLDIGYVDFDRPAEAGLDRQRVSALLEPVAAAAGAILAEHGIVALHLRSGRGHQLVWRIRRGSRAFARLASAGQVPPRLRELYARPHPPSDEPVPREMGAAYAALALVMELVAHRIKRKAAPLCTVPVEITNLAVGPGERGREMISIDLSGYADPLSARTLRVPFTGLDGAPEPAAGTCCLIPDAAEGMERLVDYYRASALSQFHTWFYSQEPAPPPELDETSALLELERLPPCARTILSCPGGLLSASSGVERVTRVLLSFGWHPRHIAGLVRSRYERTGPWGEGWNARDPGSLADFYVRLFSGLFFVGTDDLVSFNCQSARESGFCFHPVCSCNLLDYRGPLLERRAHGRLARRPLDRVVGGEE